MKERIDMSYFALGNRDFKCLKSHPNIFKSTSSVKSTASNLMQRNYLDFDPGIVSDTSSRSKYFINYNKELSKGIDIFYKYHPEYKYYHDINEQNKNLNNYLNPISQYTYRENPMIQSAEQLLCIQRQKKSCGNINPKKFKILNTENNEWKCDKKNNKILNSTKSCENLKTDSNDYTIPLKNPRNENILVSNDFHLPCSTNAERRIKPPSKTPNLEDLKFGSFLESKLSPEYLRNYDKESLKNIDKYYIDKKENIHILSRFGNWITLKPDDKNRSHALEKLKHGTYETSIIAPDWMNISSRRKKNLSCVNGELNNDIFAKQFKPVLYNTNLRDKTNLTILQDKDQKNAKPVYLRDSYEKNRILLSQKKENE